MAGRIVTCSEGYVAFVPAPLPPRLSFTRELAVALSRADAALGALSGLGDELPSPAAMAAPFLRQEALCCSRIEGADVSLTEVLLDEIAAAPPGSHPDQLAGVRNVLATLVYGVECVAKLPLDLALVRSLHQRLLHGATATARAPGQFRTTQNWIGPPGATLASCDVRPSAGTTDERGARPARGIPGPARPTARHRAVRTGSRAVRIHPPVRRQQRAPGPHPHRPLSRLARQALTAAPVSLRLSRGAPPRVLHPAAARAYSRRMAAVAALLRRGRPRNGAARPHCRHASCSASVLVTAPRPRARRRRSWTSSSCRPSLPCVTCGVRWR